MAVQLGIDVLTANNFDVLAGKRVGLMTNPSGVNRDLVSTVDVLRHADAVNLVALFGPEHGVFAVEADGMAVDDGRDPRTGLMAFSLYGATMRPTAAMLAEIDVMVVDIQDVGVRFYTYIWTLSHVLEACGAAGVPVIVLDRPNPLGGVAVHGALLDARYDTMVGRRALPVQHGLTIGEFARLFNGEWNPTPADVSVVTCDGWQREMLWPDTGLMWVPTSPAMPNLTTVAHYPGACFIEGTTLSEGRGTAIPFEVVGMPGMDGWALAEQLNALGLDGVRFRAHPFIPMSSKHKNEKCFGVQVHITDAQAYNPLHSWMYILEAIWKSYGDQVGWNETHFDRLIGDPHARQDIEQGNVDAMLARWAQDVEAFNAQREPYLLY